MKMLKFVHEKAEDSLSLGITDVDPPFFYMTKHPYPRLNSPLCPLALSLAINTS